MRISSILYPNIPVLAVALLTLVGMVQTEDKSDADPKKSEAKTEVIAIVGGDIHTVTGPVVRQGTILVEDGKILEIGQSVKVPEGATIIDAKGKVVTPGFVAINMSRVGVGQTPTEKDKLIDGLNPFDRNIKYSLGVGITSGSLELSQRGGRRRRRAGAPQELFPGLQEPIEEYVTEAMMDFGDLDTSLCPCCGLAILPTEPITPTPPAAPTPRKMAVLKMSYGDLDSMLVKEDAFYSVSPGALSGALARHNFRKNLKLARESIEAEKKKASEKPAATKSSSAKGSVTKTAAKGKSSSSKKGSSRSATPRKPKVNANLVKLLKREIALLVRANTVDEINDMVDLSIEQGYDLIIDGGIEAWGLGRKTGSLRRQCDLHAAVSTPSSKGS